MKVENETFDGLFDEETKTVKVTRTRINLGQFVTSENSAAVGIKSVHGPGQEDMDNYIAYVYIGSEDDANYVAASDARELADFFTRLAEALEEKDAAYASR